MKLKIIPLSGVEKVGRNCTAIEYGEDIIVVDLGLGFPGPDLFGVDYTLPDVTYLEKNKDKIRGLIITHGHLDHIGGIPYLIKKIGNPPIFATKLTVGLIQDRLKESSITGVKTKIINTKESFSLGVFKINPFHVVHNIPDSVGFSIETPLGMIIHTGDFKFDEHPADQKPIDKSRLREFAKQKVLICLSDSTNATLAGHTISEEKVGKMIDIIIKNSRGRIIFTTFSTLISRIHQVMNACQKYHRKIAVAGFSIKKSIALAQELGYLPIPKNLFIDLTKIKSYPDKSILILASGTQGEERSAMTRISQNEYRLVKMKKQDTVVFSSSVIPGDELAVHKVMNGIIDQGAKMIYQPIFGLGIHSSGHAYQEDLRELLKLIKPKFFMPVHGEHYMQAKHIELAESVGIRRENCFMMENGQVLEIDSQKRAKILNKKVANLSVVVEAKKVEILKENMLKVRKLMAQSGICIVNIQRKKRHSRIKVEFLGISVDNKIIDEAKNKIEKLIKRYGLNEQAKIKNSLGDFLLNKVGKKPLIVII